MADTEEREAKSGWFSTEKQLLLVLCSINLLNFMDRGVVASNGVNGSPGNYSCFESEPCFEGRGIQGEFSLSYFQDGVLSSVFLVGLLVASPIFAELSKTFDPMRVMGVGLSMWTLAVAGCGFSFNFNSIAAFRMLVGVAEASFASLAAPIVAAQAPIHRRAVWLSLFYCCGPAGLSLGYLYGSYVGSVLNWRAAFWIEALLMLPFAVFGILFGPAHLKNRKLNVLHRRGNPAWIKVGHTNASSLLQGEKDEETPSPPSPLVSLGGKVRGGECCGFDFLTKTLQMLNKQVTGLGIDVARLLQQKVYMTVVLGFVFHRFVLGTFAYWGPKIGQELFSMDNADTVFGLVTIVAGIPGTLFGGIVLDRLGSTIPNAFKFCSLAMCVGGVMCVAAFLSQSVRWFVPLFILGEFSLLSVQAPVYFTLLHSVPPLLRPIAMAMSTVTISVLGDVPSSPIIGALQDIVGNWRTTALLLSCIPLISAALWGVGTLLGQPTMDSEEGEG